jgi:hypothetical protein
MNRNKRVFTAEDRAKGGNTSTLFKSLAISLKSRKKCQTSCPFFEMCPANAMSLGYRDKNKPEEDQKCLMKEFPITVRQQFINLFLTGEEGVIHAIKTALHNYMVDVDAYGNLRDKKDMVQLMLQFYKEVYNSPRKAGVKKEPLTITIRRVGMAPETILVNPHGQLPEGITSQDLLAVQNGDITEGDPESLINSPVIDRIMSRPVYMEEIKIESNFNDIMEEEDE